MEQVRGVVLPSPTVFREDGSVDETLMRELTDWFVACGVHAFFVLGSYGQGPALHPAERKKVAEIIVQQVKHRVPVVVHIGAVDPFTAIELGKHAQSIGAEAVGVPDRRHRSGSDSLDPADEAIQGVAPRSS